LARANKVNLSLISCFVLYSTISHHFHLFSLYLFIRYLFNW
jgi:hypothetical protein